jgi:hypothetical protein
MPGWLGATLGGGPNFNGCASPEIEATLRSETFEKFGWNQAQLAIDQSRIAVAARVPVSRSSRGPGYQVHGTAN